MSWKLVLKCTHKSKGIQWNCDTLPKRYQLNPKCLGNWFQNVPTNPKESNGIAIHFPKDITQILEINFKMCPQIQRNPMELRYTSQKIWKLVLKCTHKSKGIQWNCDTLPKRYHPNPKFLFVFKMYPQIQRNPMEL